MHIKNLKLHNFRNYDDISINFSSKSNIIIGNNGSGKTNIVEAIYVLGLTKSFRGTTESVLIKNDKNETIIEGDIYNDLTKKYTVSFSNKEKKVKINNKVVDKISNYISNINIILFNPDDLKVIKLSPNLRRKMLNIDISQLNNKYLINLSIYNKLLKQRNSYLKTLYLNNYASKEYLDILTNKLIELGQSIYLERKLFLEKINSKISKIYKNICKDGILEVFYYSIYNDSLEKVKKKYKDNLNKDLMFGKTEIGIHHDDIIFKLDGNLLKDYGSEGQQKNAILAFKLSEIDIFKEIKKNNPILILDDLFSELDNEKINNIMKYLNNDIQKFITVTDLDYVNKKFINESNVFEVKNGYIKNFNRGEINEE